MYNKKALAKFQTVYEDKQEHNTSAKKKTKGDLEKESEKHRNDIREIKNAIMKKNKDWLETNENARGKPKRQNGKRKRRSKSKWNTERE